MYALGIAAVPARPARLAAGAPRLSARRTALTATRRPLVVAASEEKPFIGRARIPATVDQATFQNQMFQWATSLTVSGQNMPFAMPLKVDKTEDGFTIGLMTVNDGSVDTVCSIIAKQEGEFFMVYEESESEKEFMDVPMIMSSMVTAIKRSVATSPK